MRLNISHQIGGIGRKRKRTGKTGADFSAKVSGLKSQTSYVFRGVSMENGCYNLAQAGPTDSL
ncbi:MAG: hypothetical protein V8S95_13945 [Odoribacter sp.]